jgi:polygalacturonase
MYGNSEMSVPRFLKRTSDLDESRDAIVRRELEQILKSHAFRRSQRCSAFLSFVVGRALEGHAEELKERTIGIALFHRSPTYGTAEDSIVRVSAIEVRKRLSRYYAEHLRDSPLRVDLPVGCYVPTFHWRLLEEDKRVNRRDLLAFGAATSSLSLPSYATGSSITTNRIFDVRRYGARGDGKTKDTEAIQRAISAAARAGGGTVFLGPGDYLSGGIVLKSNVTFYLDTGATLRGSEDLADYPPRSGPNPHGDANVHHLIFARGAENIALCGLGRIDGQGRAYWAPSGRPQNPEDFWRESVSNSFKPLPGDARPSPMLEFVGCKNLRIEDITLANSAGWTMRPIDCESVFIRGVRVRNPVYGPNTDGMDVTCCRNVFIADCDISTGDDALCLKSENPYGGEVKPTKNIVITNCVLTGCCNGFKMGTATKGAFENITFTNSVIYNEDVPLNHRIIAGIAIEMVDGGSVNGIVVSNIQMQNTRTPIFIRLGNRSGNPPSGPKPGALRGIMIDNIHATGAILTSSITGLPGHHIEDVTLSNLRVDTVEGGEQEWVAREVPERASAYPEARMFGRLPSYGFYCRHARGVRFKDVRIETRKPDERPMFLCEDMKSLEIVDVSGSAPASQEPLIVLRNVQRAFIQGCCAPQRLSRFLTVGGTDSSDVSLIGSDLRGCTVATQSVEGAAQDVVFEAGNITLAR